MSLGQSIGLVGFIVSLYILWQIRLVVLLIFTSVVLATAIDRLVRLLQRLHLKRGIAIALSITLLLALLVGFFVVVVPPFVEQLQQLVDRVPQGIEQLRGWATWLQDLIPEQVVEDLRGLRGFTQQLQSFATRLFGNFFTLFSNSLGIILNSLLVLVLTIMLLANPAPYRQGFILLFPSFYRRRVEDILQQCEFALGGWVTGILFNMFVIAALSWIGLLLLQVPLSFANAILAGLLTFIPNLGPTLSIIPPMALALIDAPWKALAVLGLYVAIQQIESNVLTPIVMQKQVSLLPAITLASQVIFASFFGFLGLLLALPLLVVTQVWVKELLVKDVLNNWQRNESSNSRLAPVRKSDSVK